MFFVWIQSFSCRCCCWHLVQFVNYLALISQMSIVHSNHLQCMFVTIIYVADLSTVFSNLLQRPALWVHIYAVQAITAFPLHSKHIQTAADWTQGWSIPSQCFYIHAGASWVPRLDKTTFAHLWMQEHNVIEGTACGWRPTAYAFCGIHLFYYDRTCMSPISSAVCVPCLSFAIACKQLIQTPCSSLFHRMGNGSLRKTA